MSINNSGESLRDQGKGAGGEVKHGISNGEAGRFKNTQASICSIGLALIPTKWEKNTNRKGAGEVDFWLAAVRPESLAGHPRGLEMLNEGCVQEEDDEEQEDDAFALQQSQTWSPEPVNADIQNTAKAQRMHDIISMLVHIYGSKDLFINEYRSFHSLSVVARALLFAASTPDEIALASSCG
jgi:hypothetical protein